MFQKFNTYFLNGPLERFTGNFKQVEFYVTLDLTSVFFVYLTNPVIISPIFQLKLEVRLVSFTGN